MHKKIIIEKYIALFEQELVDCLEAANKAHLAATDDQSVAETQYDTLAIEAAYLAEGQTKRSFELKKTIEQFKALLGSTLYQKNFDKASPVTIGALLQMSSNADDNHWLFVAPAAGGYKITYQDSITNIAIPTDMTITLVTPLSPLGKALMGKYVDDDISYRVGHKLIETTIMLLR
jgi:hypothetical protein